MFRRSRRSGGAVETAALGSGDAVGGGSAKLGHWGLAGLAVGVPLAWPHAVARC